jgi:hypothetical protein
MAVMIELVEATLVTTTSFGSWLPGDVRGYVERGRILPPAPALAAYAKSKLKGSPVAFKDQEQDILFEALTAAALEFGYRLSDVVVEATHLHWIIAHGDDAEAMVGRLKTRLRQRLNRGRIWTAGYCARELTNLNALDAARAYLSRHDGLRMLAGKIIAPVRSSP